MTACEFAEGLTAIDVLTFIFCQWPNDFPNLWGGKIWEFKNLAKLIIIIALKKNKNSRILNSVKSPKIRNSLNILLICWSMWCIGSIPCFHFFFNRKWTWTKRGLSILKPKKKQLTWLRKLNQESKWICCVILILLCIIIIMSIKNCIFKNWSPVCYGKHLGIKINVRPSACLVKTVPVREMKPIAQPMVRVG